jgi:hypothetical protein
MSRLPGIKKEKQPQGELPRWDECPYPELHVFPHKIKGRVINFPRLSMGGTGEWDFENGQPPKVVMRCMLGHEWIPVLSGGHVYPVRTTDEEPAPGE